MANGKGNASTSFDIFSSLLTSFVEVTVFITGCFQCSKNTDYYHKSERDRAWFDDQRIQVEQPYCYVNPVAAQTPDSNNKHAPHNSSNGKIIHNNGDQNLNSNNWRRSRRPENAAKSPQPAELSADHSKKNGKYKNEQYQSFAVNVEEEYLDSKKNSLRCEGDTPVRTTKINQEVPMKRGKMRSPVAHRRIWHQLSADRNDIDWDSVSFDSSNEDELSLGEFKLFDDIWRSCELENAFVDYNIAAFSNHSLNSANQQSSSGRKSPGEKFEDIFPSRKYLEAKISENVDSTSSLDSESDFSLTKTSTCSNFSVIKFPSNIIEPDELSQLIDMCICSNTKDNLDDNISRHLKHFCDTDFTISGKTYSINLLYDLVRQIMLENYIEYPSSSNLSKLIPLNNVKRKIFNVMKVSDGGRTKDGLCFCKPTSDMDKMPDFIDRIINDEIRTETKHWQSFDLEAKAMKESIYKDIFNDLINATAIEASLLLSKKFSAFKL